GRAREQREQDAGEEPVVVRRARTCMRAREDRRRRLALEVVDRDARVLATREPVRTNLDERADERTVLVQRRPVERRVLLEGERDVGAVVDVPEQSAKGAEAEAAERAIQVRSTHGTGFRLRSEC